ncbi:hypothetical protein GF314_02105 [bacterium]|nr:hypothetical protein [bacterium]
MIRHARTARNRHSPASLLGPPAPCMLVARSPARTLRKDAMVPRLVLAALLLLPGLSALADAWPDGKELTGRLLDLARLDRATVHELGRSAGDQTLRLLEIAPVRASDGGDPAILVLANLEGDLPLASLTAIELAAEALAATEGPAAAVRWYVLPLANPDGLDRWFDRPRAPGGRNDAPVDDDADGLAAEDPPDDLDGDGWITWMLVEDPAGDWFLDDQGLPVRADPARDHPGQYRRELEGTDQDGDGRLNEDPPGGVDLARNYPHGFEYLTGGGRWPGDQPETRAVLEFAFARPDIALVVVLGATSNLWTVPEPEPEPDADQTVTPGWRLARALGLDPGSEYPLRTVLRAAREAGSRVSLTPEAVKARLHLGPLEKPLPADIAWWGALSDRYHAYLRDHGLAAPRLAPDPPPPGGAAPWAYFQYGTPAVAVDLWSLPCEPDTAVIDSTVAHPAPAPDPVHVQLQRRTERDQHEGWDPWTEVTLPDGTPALVGGPVPGATRTPAAYAATTRSRALVPFCLELAGWLPRLELAPLVITDRGGDVHAVTATVRNPGRLPYPTAMGEVNQRPAPIAVTLEGGEPLQQDRRRTVARLTAGGAATVRWLVRTDRPDDLAVTATAPSLGTVTVKGGAR